MTLVDTWASTAAGAFALSENNLYTVDAFREYFEHLKPDGMIAITRWEFAKPREALRVVSQAMEALHELGVADTSQNFIVVSDGALDTDGKPVLVLAKKTPFTMEEQKAVLNHIEGSDGNGANLNLHVLYMPATGDRPGMAHPAFAELIRGQDARAFSATYPYNVSPVTDNAPFFFFTLKPEQVFRGSDAGGIDWKVNLGIAILGIVLIVSIVAVMLFLVLPLALSPRHPLRPQHAGAVFHRHRPGLHHGGDRLYSALRVVSRLSDLRPDRGRFPYAALQRRRQPGFAASGSAIRRVCCVALAFIVIALLLYVFALPHILEAMIGLPLRPSWLISGLLLVPLGFAMGMPFPSGLRALSPGSPPAARQNTEPSNGRGP